MDWINIVKSIPDLISGLSGIIKNNRATKDALLRELKLNLKAFETASKSGNPNYDRLIDLLKNDAIKLARKERFTFNTIKFGTINATYINDSRNNKYIEKDCAWLFKNIDEKIEDLKNQKNYFGSFKNAEKTNVKLQFSNLFYKMKLLAEFIR